MKKYLLVSLTILFAATFVWAQNAATAEPSVDIEADATLSWGIDLGPGGAKHGFKNEASWSVKFPLLKKADKTSTKNDVPVYGEVSLTDVGLNLVSEKDSGGRFALDGNVGGLEAKLVIYGAYLTVFDTPDFSTNYAEIWVPVDKNKKYRPQDKGYRFDPGFDGYGTKIGYANKDFMDLDVGLKLGSSSNWDPNSASTIYHQKYFDGNTVLKDKEAIWNGTTWVYGSTTRFPAAGWYYFKKDTDPDPATSQYGVGFDLSMKPLDKMLAFALTVNTTLSKSYPDANLNFGVEVTSEPMDGLKLQAGFDGAYDFTNATFEWDTVFTAGYKWISAGVYAEDFSGTGTDLSVFAQFVTKGDKKDATNLVEGLDAGAYVGMYRLIGNLSSSKFPLFAKVWGAYKININDSMWLKPFADVWLETNHGSSAVGLAYDLGVKFSPVEKVEVQAKWNHGSINKNTHMGIIKKSVLNSEHYGKFVLSLTVTY
ncbi:MSP porin [Treponema sp. OMZ 857]|uniref:major outer sheath protein Msp n=1 Tax=Treponema sp. OMZ 857 TaxID=1643513 RepID=UPI0020A24317|nr:MSP porin [Treponema sp. OMZ 857]UTC44550.1 MSP porin [Treponema sp. OMZ 857]